MKKLQGISFSINPQIKAIMKAIHHAVKETSASISASPWATYLSVKNEPLGIEHYASRPLPSTMGLPGVHGYHPQNGSLGSIPSTPLSAALGPAAQAAGPGKASSGRPGINFFERAESYANSYSATRQRDNLYSKRIP